MSDASFSDQPVPGTGNTLPVPRPVAMRMPLRRLRWLPWAIAALALAAVAALAIAWRSQQRLQSLEQEMVRRQQDSQSQSAEARLLARQAQDLTRESAAKLALLEARVAEVAVQRGQLDELMQSLIRSRDENLLADIDTGIRLAMQQSAITGSAESLVAALKQADERLARHNQPRLENVRRAIASDVDRVKAVGMADLPSLSLKLEEAARMVDELPLLSQADGRRAVAAAALTAPAASTAATARAAAASAARARAGWPNWLQALNAHGADGLARVGEEVRSLVRVTRIDHPEAALMAPDNAFFLRENLKLRLLNARLALLSRQYDTVQSDLAAAQSLIDRYFDRSLRRTVLATELLRQVAAQARHITVLRPDETLAALAAVYPGLAGR